MKAARNLASSGASVRQMRRVVIGMVSVLCLALVTAAGLEYLESRHIDSLIGYSEDNASWAVHQLETEQQRLELALLRAKDGAPGALQDAALRYEIFASRQNVLATGAFRRKLHELPAYGALMAAFDAFFARYDPMIADGLQPREIDPLLAGAAAMYQPSHALVLSENAMLNQAETDARAHAESVEDISRVIISGLGLAVLCFAGYAFAVLRRAEKFELALARSDHVLRSALHEAQGANAAKSSFLANMSHELRTPLNAVIGFSEFLEISAAEKLDEHQRGYLRDIRASGRHLLDILSSILELSKMEAGKVELQIDQVAPGTVIEECVRMLSCKFSQKGVSLETTALDDLPPILGDQTRLRQIFLNLMSNAVNYSSEGGRVSIRGEAAGGFVTLRVEDEGIGMHSADIEIALRPFERIRNAQTSNQDGVGLGLTIVKTLVDIHGGQLEIESEIGRGTLVAVRLPAGSRPNGAHPHASHSMPVHALQPAIATD
ncbi:MAG TPA: HAMP domain-containing sensor histidine kinase [Dongiaceae bacterium]|jgi:signal transduction histidine kinase|nr:HAMP domain-containing sensor histidine kinase [Dongiaceae bacterium]